MSTVIIILWVSGGINLAWMLYSNVLCSKQKDWDFPVSFIFGVRGVDSSNRGVRAHEFTHLIMGASLWLCLSQSLTYCALVTYFGTWWSLLYCVPMYWVLHTILRWFLETTADIAGWIADPENYWADVSAIQNKWCANASRVRFLSIYPPYRLLLMEE